MSSSLFWAKFPRRAGGDINSLNTHLLHTLDVSCSEPLGSGSWSLQGEMVPFPVLWGSQPGAIANFPPPLWTHPRWMNETSYLCRALYPGDGDS